MNRSRSWALTGTPIENHPDDLVNIFAFVDPDRIPPETPPRRLPAYTSDSILRRTKDMVQSDMPPKTVRDLEVELTPAQRAAYTMAEDEGVVHLNELGDTITVQHVFQLVMRLKQICNFDPLTGESAKLEQLLMDMEEVAESGRKAIIFSQWVEPLQVLAKALVAFGPLQYHGKIAAVRADADPRSLSQRPGLPRSPDELWNRQRRAESAVRQLRVPVRSVVEPGGGGPGDQPGSPHRPEEPGHGDAVPF